MIRIGLLDDHKLFAEGIRQLINSKKGMSFSFYASDFEQCREELLKNNCDVLLLDISLRDENGLDFIPEIIKISEKTKVLVLTMHINPSICRIAIEAGADGFITKDRTPEELIRAVTHVMKGQQYIPLDMCITMEECREGTAECQKISSLSKREMQVFRLLCAGHTLKEIADQLNVTTKTICAHKYRIMEKTEARNMVELTKMAIRNFFTRA